MVLGAVTLAATIPLLATSSMQLQNESQKVTTQSEEQLKTTKCLLKARPSTSSDQSTRDLLKQTVVVVRQGSIQLESIDAFTSHPVMAYLLPFPSQTYDGLVTTIDIDQMLNWVYIDSDTYQLRHGIRVEAQKHISGPAKLVKGSEAGEWHLAYFDREGFKAVKEDDEHWSIYFDKDGDGLKGKCHGKAVVDIELVRVPWEDDAES